MKKRVFDTDEQRINAYIDRLPTLKVSAHAGRALVHDATPKSISAVCRAYSVDTRGCTEREDYTLALRSMPLSTLRRACKDAGVPLGICPERSELLDALRDDYAKRKVEGDPVFGTDTCFVCAQSFEPDEQISVLLCDHALHQSCLKTWAQTQFCATLEMPTCGLCRSPIKPTCSLRASAAPRNVRLRAESDARDVQE